MFKPIEEISAILDALHHKHFHFLQADKKEGATISLADILSRCILPWHLEKIKFGVFDFCKNQ